MQNIQQFITKVGYVSPIVKTVALRARRNILTGSLDGVYGVSGSAGHDGGYDSYNEDDDL